MKAYIYCILFLLFSANSQALDIARAYRLIPHQQTPFYLRKSNLPDSEARYISKLLALSELAMAERVEAMIDGPGKSRYDADIATILGKLSKLETPARLRPVYQHIVTAIGEHRSYFALQISVDANAKAKQKQLVKSSSQHLISAYGLLKQLYPQETKHNQQAFFDYLCALDFI